MIQAKTDSLTNNIIAILEKDLSTLTNHPSRKNALEYLQTLGLPGNKHEEYRHTPLSRALEKNFDLSNEYKQPGVPGNLPGQTIEFPSSYRVVLINGIFSEAHSSLPSTKGITITSLEDAVNKNIPEVTAHLAHYVDGKLDAFSAWNTAAWKSGVFISADDKSVVDKPIVIQYLADATVQPVISTIRNLFVIGKNSEVTILQKFDSTGTNNHFCNIVTEAVVNENSGLNLYTLQEDEGSHYQFNQTFVYQKNASRVNAYTFTLDGKLIRNNLILTLDGEGCESHMYGLYLLKGDTLADNHTVADHQKPNSFSNELYKGVMQDKAKGVFNGKIYVRPNAQKTNAFQSNRNILLSDEATINTKPQLEIWADDVKCSHGCTSGQLDEEAMFYLQTRGISRDAAQAMLLYAFAGEVLEAIAVPEVKKYLEKTVSDRLYKTP